MPTAALRPARPLAILALGAAAFDLAVFLVLHATQPGVDVLRDPTSNYVHGTLGFLSPLAAAAVGIGGLCLAVACWRVVSGAAARIGAILLALFGLAKLAQAFFPIDADGQATASGAAHNLLGNIAFFVLPVAAVLLTGAVARATGHGRPVWRPAAVYGLLVGLTVLVLAGDALGWFGVAQRLYLVGAAGWAALIALWLLRSPRARPATAG